MPIGRFFFHRIDNGRSHDKRLNPVSPLIATVVGVQSFTDIVVASEGIATDVCLYVMDLLEYDISRSHIMLLRLVSAVPVFYYYP